MIPRYTHPDMGRIWSEERRFETWLQVEIAAARVMADAGIIPKDAARDIAERSAFDVERINAIEAVTKHDVIASPPPWPSTWDPRRAGCTSA
jgi:adenylosuccinate lyase